MIGKVSQAERIAVSASAHARQRPFETRSWEKYKHLEFMALRHDLYWHLLGAIGAATKVFHSL